MPYDPRKLRWLLVPMLAGLALTGCQPVESAPAPSQTSPSASPPTISPSPTAPATPTPKPATAEGPAENMPVPEMPEAARENSKDGAISFAEHYFDIINYSTATTTSDQLKALTSRECKLCGERFIDPLDTAVLNDAWQVGGLYSFQLVDLIVPIEDRAVAVFNFSSSPQAIYVEPNEPVVEWDAVKNGIVSFELEFDTSWEVIGIVTPEDG